MDMGWWWQRNNKIENNIYGEDIIELRSFTTIGKCSKGSTCFLEPAVSCYSCEKFCPSKDVDSHKNALIQIEEKRKHIKDTSSGAAVQLIDESYLGCLAAISFAKDKSVLGIEELTHIKVDQIDE